MQVCVSFTSGFLHNSCEKGMNTDFISFLAAFLDVNLHEPVTDLKKKTLNGFGISILKPEC